MGIKSKTQLEDTFLFQIKTLGLPEPVREHRFMAPVRQFRFDFAWPDVMLAVEVEGGTFARGKSRHTTGSGFHNDCIKYNYAVLYQWWVIKGDVKMVNDWSLAKTVKVWFKHYGGER